jgi:hypothetical protein
VCLGVRILLLPPPSGSPWLAIDSMLDAGQFAPQQSVLDIGAGDGRVLVRAVQRGASRAVGVEHDADVHAMGIAHLDAAFADAPTLRARCVLQHTDARQCVPAAFDLITLFLLPHGLAALEPWLWQALRDTSTRATPVHVVTQGWPFPHRQPDRVAGDGNVFVYKIWPVNPDLRATRPIG